METKDMYKDLVIGTAIIVLLSMALIVGMQFLANRSFEIPEFEGMKDMDVFRNADSAKAFLSVDDFKQYLENAPQEDFMQGRFAFGAPQMMRAEMSLDGVAMDSDANKSASGESNVNRVSGTNVQVIGIDEPDMVKTDGKEIYVADPYYRNKNMPIMFEETSSGISSAEQDLAPALIEIEGRSKIAPPPRSAGGVHAIKAFPPADMNVDNVIEGNGELLLADNILLVMGSTQVLGYDVSDVASPKKAWTIDIDERNQMVSSRLYNGDLYLITKTSIAQNVPCPIEPMRIGGQGVSIACDNIYHPVTPVSVDATFTIVKVDAQDGTVKEKTSFVGSMGSSVVYMSSNALYISYTYPINMLDIMVPFIEKNKEIFPSDIVDKAKKLNNYDISETSKLQELELLFQEASMSLSKDEKLKFENELENRLQECLETNKRELEKTGIAKIDLDNLKFERVGIVAGRLLNQFSLDEYDGHLRVATTLGGTWGRFGGRQQSANDVNILDSNMRIAGSVQDMGIDERIYAVRFIRDKGYVVTFRQIDPFIVLDLSDPKNPKKKGELKIPGYSSYLHPLNEDRILGIGKEDANVKMSLFDVSDADNPIERSKYLLDEYWSDILNTHHAFLMDDKNEIFFLPGSKGGYIFTYEKDRIELKKAISDIQARRAIYINDYLYIVGLDKIVVLNESDWERVKELEL